VAALTYDKDGRAAATTILPGSVVAQTDRFVKAYCSDNRPMAAPSAETLPKTLDRLRGAGINQATGPRVSLAGLWCSLPLEAGCRLRRTRFDPAPISDRWIPR
jgi:cytochrome o ubiquinol oxidase subunit 2